APCRLREQVAPGAVAKQKHRILSPRVLIMTVDGSEPLEMIDAERGRRPRASGWPSNRRFPRLLLNRKRYRDTVSQGTADSENHDAVDSPGSRTCRTDGQHCVCSPA